MVRVKICGITNIDDARGALDCGADAIGLVFAKSSRQVSQRTAELISRAVGPWISVVGVFVDEKAGTMRRIAKECGLSAVQMHGRESAATMAALKGVKIIKAFHVDRNFSTSGVKAYSSADAFLFDTKISGQAGGTGVRFDWKILKSFRASKPLIISGGLDPANVAEAVNFFGPYGVDVSSGVEKSAGKKDLRLVKEFIKNAKKI